MALLGVLVPFLGSAPVAAKGGVEPHLRETTGGTSTSCPEGSNEWCTATASADVSARTVQIGADLRPPLGSAAGIQARASAVLSDTYRMRRADQVAGRLNIAVTRRQAASSGTGEVSLAVQFCLKSGDRSSCSITSLRATALERGSCTLEVDLVLTHVGMRSVTFETDLYGAAVLRYGPYRTPPFGSAGFDVVGRVSTSPLAEAPADPGRISDTCGLMS